MLLSNQRIALRPQSEPKHVPFAISLKPAVGDADNLSEGACGSTNRPAESLTQSATYPARGISAAPRLQETGAAQKIWTVEVNRVS